MAMGGRRSYSYAFLALVLWTSFGLGKFQQQCENIPNELRFDCYPEGEASQENCLNRGCCWRMPSISFEDGEASLDIPHCFYPTNYGYEVVDKQHTQTGYALKLSRRGHLGPYGKDVINLTVDVRLEDENRLHFKIYDPSNQRYEVPIKTPEVKTMSPSQNYDVSITTFPFGIAVTRASSGTVIFNSSVGGMIFEDQFIQLSSLLPSNNIYGLGEHAAPLKLDVKWSQATLFARDQGTPEGLSNLYGVFPVYMSLEDDGNANGVFLLNSNAMDLILQPTPAITYRTIGGVLDFYVFLGPTPEKVVQQFTEVVGRPFMPPYWGLGFHLCRYGYRSLDDLKTVNDRMRTYGIPQDVQWADIDYMRSSLDFTIDSTGWSGLKDFVDKLHINFHQHFIPIVDPGISNTQPLGSYPPYDLGLKMGVFVNDSSGVPLVAKLWPGNIVFPDFLYSVTADYWQELLSQFSKEVAFDGLWFDMNEPSSLADGSLSGCPNSTLDHPPYVPHVKGGFLYQFTICMSAKHNKYFHYDVHNVYGLSAAAVTMRALQKIRGKRTVLMSRSTFPSSGQYGGHWLGDNRADWNDLYLSIPGILNFNMFGVPMVGAVICGFYADASQELCARWIQLGAFYPFARNQKSKGTKVQDPTAFGDDFARMARDVLLTRYRLLPYLYTLYAEAHVEGSAVARPLFYEFPQDSNTWAMDKQFLLGPALLITPVLLQGSTSVEGYFPNATWYDGVDGSILQTSGSQYHTLSAPWDKINFHFRGGYIIPTQPPNITTYLSRQNPFELIVALSSLGVASGSLFYDDGESLDPFVSAPYLLVKYAVSQGKLLASVDPRSSYSPTPPLAYLHVFGVPQSPDSVTVNGVEIKSFSYNPTTKVLTVSGLTLTMDKDFSIIWS